MLLYTYYLLDTSRREIACWSRQKTKEIQSRAELPLALTAAVPQLRLPLLKWAAV